MKLLIEDNDGCIETVVENIEGYDLEKHLAASQIILDIHNAVKRLDTSIKLHNNYTGSIILRIGMTIVHLPTKVRMKLLAIEKQGKVLRFDTGSLDTSWMEARLGEYGADRKD